jgi:hypothetical protein
MKEFFTSYQYLCSLLIWLVFYFVGLIIFYKYRKSILLSSLLAMPQALFAIFLVPAAWQPKRIFVFGTGIEDLIFCFLSGGLVWMSVLLYCRENTPLDFKLKTIFKRLVYCTLFGIFAVVLMTTLTEIKGYLIPFIVMTTWCTILIILNPSYIRLLLIGMASFFVIWILILLAIINIWPGIPSLWSWDNLWGLSFLKFPLEELVWALLYGGSWSLSIAFILNVRLKNR